MNASAVSFPSRRKSGSLRVDRPRTSAAPYTGRIAHPYVLSEIEWAEARRLGRERFVAARKAGVENAKKGGQSNEQTDVEGIAAEIAFGRLFDLLWDATIFVRSGGADFVQPDGTSIDVKQTRWPGGKLLRIRGYERLSDGRRVEWPLEKYCNYYALMTGAERGPYTFRGWTTRERLIRSEYLGADDRFPDTYAMPQSRLENKLLGDYRWN